VVNNFLLFVAGAGVPDANGFPSYDERVLHELTNRARVDPQYEMTLCGSPCGEAACYSPMPPLYYNKLMNYPARFHAAHTHTNGYFAHESACTLVSTINTIWPSSCTNAEASCSCVSGSLSCSGTCTSTWGRISMWGGSGSGENIVSVAGKTGFYLWLYENSPSSTCSFSSANGHRWNILKQTGSIGYGVSTYAVGDFTSAIDDAENSKIASGSHWAGTGGLTEFWANWYDASGEEPTQALINYDSTCYVMSKGRGANAGNTAYNVNITVTAGCHPYAFIFYDGTTPVYYPHSGTLLAGSSCNAWQDVAPSSCELTSSSQPQSGSPTSTASNSKISMFLVVSTVALMMIAI